MAIPVDDVFGMDFSDISTGETIGTVPPGQVLRDEFLLPLGLSGRALARELGVPSNRVTEIVSGGRSISARTALMLADRFGTTPEFWLNLQMAHDLEEARRSMHRAA